MTITTCMLDMNSFYTHKKNSELTNLNKQKKIGPPIRLCAINNIEITCYPSIDCTLCTIDIFNICDVFRICILGPFCIWLGPISIPEQDNVDMFQYVHNVHRSIEQNI